MVSLVTMSCPKLRLASTVAKILLLTLSSYWLTWRQEIGFMQLMTTLPSQHSSQTQFIAALVKRWKTTSLLLKRGPKSSLNLPTWLRLLERTGFCTSAVSRRTSRTRRKTGLKATTFLLVRTLPTLLSSWWAPSSDDLIYIY